jgi:hypothetical protein
MGGCTRCVGRQHGSALGMGQASRVAHLDQHRRQPTSTTTRSHGDKTTYPLYIHIATFAESSHAQLYRSPGPCSRAVAMSAPPQGQAPPGQQPLQLLKVDDVPKLQSLNEDLKQKYRPIFQQLWNTIGTKTPGGPEHTQARTKLQEFSQKLIAQERVSVPASHAQGLHTDCSSRHSVNESSRTPHSRTKQRVGNRHSPPRRPSRIHS